MLAAHPELAAVLTITDGRSHDVLEAADVVLVASGTATLEAALYKRPMVIAYKMPALSAWLMRRKGRIPYVGLPNILAEQPLVPELLQEQATPEALADAVLAQLSDPRRRELLAAALRRDASVPAARHGRARRTDHLRRDAPMSSRRASVNLDLFEQMARRKRPHLRHRRSRAGVRSPDR